MENSIYKNSLILVAFVLLFGCVNQNHIYKINGTVKPDKSGEEVMLYKFRGDSIFSIDTAKITKGEFHFTGNECLDDIAIITTGNYPNLVRSAELALDGGIIKVSLDSVSTVKGTPLNDDYIVYNNKLELYGDSISLLYSTNGLDNGYKLGSALDSMIKKRAQFQKSWVKNNLSNPVGRRALKKWLNNISAEDLFELYKATPKQYQSDPELKIPFEKRKLSEEIRIKREASVGKKFTDFELKTLDNQTQKLSDYVGKSKYLFIEFTASWCGPCRADMPHLKKAFDKYKDDGLAVISISLDTSLKVWKIFINESDAPWTHLSDLKGTGSELTEAYHVYGIPDGVLLDETGTILAIGQRGQFLHYTMDELLKKKVTKE